MKWDIFNKPKAIFVITVLLSLVPLIGILNKIWTGEFALWYDPARDLLSGLANLQKPTLIGPTTGIPGVFYGPYWIWLLSLGEIISRNPRVVTIVVETIPYVLLFPFILSRFSKIISVPILCMLWLLFLLSFNNYFTDLWNPHLAPLLILLAIYLQFSKTNELSLKNVLTTFFAGFVAGLVMNFQLSFGIGMLLGSILYLFGESIVGFFRTKKQSMFVMQRVAIIVLFLFGSVVAFLPFLLFELRHQFLQTKTLLNALIHYGGVVGLTGLTKQEIVQSFLGVAAKLLQVPFMVTLGVLLVAVVAYVFFSLKRKDHTKENEIKLLSILGCMTLGILYIYLTAKNPVWSYHFIGFEALFLLLIGVVINRLHIAKILLGLWIVFLSLMFTVSFFSSIKGDHTPIAGTLVAEEKIVAKVQSESNGHEYTVFPYSPAIYTYEYAYLFQTMYHKDVPYRPELNPTDSTLVFIILPPHTKEIISQDFVHFRTPPAKYATTAQWVLADGTEILKREKKPNK